MADNDYALQASYSLGNLMVNVRGKDPDDFAENLNAAEQLASQIDQTGSAIASFRQKEVTEDDAIQTLKDAGMNPQVIARTCPHGNMRFKEGTNRFGKPYKKWDCPNRVCDTIWEN